MADRRPKPTRVDVLRAYRWVLFSSPRSSAVKLCRFFIAFAATMAVLELLLPGAGVEYLSWGHLLDVGDHVVDGMVWFLALIFVRERDAARAALKRATFEYKVHPAPGDGRIVEWRSRGE